MQHFLIKCSSIMSKDFLHASDIPFCKFRCRCMSSNNHNGHASLQTTNVRHTPVSEMLKCEKRCSTESLRYTSSYVYYFPSASVNPLSSPRLWSCQLQFRWPFQDKTTEVHRELPDCPLSLRGEWRAWVAMWKDPWCDLKGCFSNPNLPQPRPPFLCHKEACPVCKGLGMPGQ